MKHVGAITPLSLMSKAEVPPFPGVEETKCAIRVSNKATVAPPTTQQPVIAPDALMLKGIVKFPLGQSIVVNSLA